MTAAVSRGLALFDLDGTLLPIDSDHAFGQFMIELGWANGDDWRTRNDVFFKQYEAGVLDLHAYVDFATGPWRNRPAADAAAARQRYMRDVIEPMLPASARALVDQHRTAGDLLAIVTATNAFVTRPIADAFGVEHLIAVDLVCDASGCYTGAIEGVPSFREGKIARVESWLAGLGLGWNSFARTHFYSDSMNDLPLLEKVSDPVATNASQALTAVARARGWRLLNLFEQ